MDWNTFITVLRKEAMTDLSRANDLERMKSDPVGAMTLRVASVVCSRLALAAEAGLGGSYEPPPAPAPKRGRKTNLDRAISAPVRKPSEASVEHMRRGWGRKSKKEKTNAA